MANKKIIKKVLKNMFSKGFLKEHDTLSEVTIQGIKSACEEALFLRDEEVDKFNWKRFHNFLDIAMAQMIQETGKLPSQTSIMDFAKYSCIKKENKKNVK